jgi:hypothetical protein
MPRKVEELATNSWSTTAVAVLAILLSAPAHSDSSPRLRAKTGTWAKEWGMGSRTTYASSNFVALTWTLTPLAGVVGQLHPQLMEVPVDAFNRLQANSQIGALSEYSETALHSNDVWCSS